MQNIENFLETSYTSFHAVKNAAAELTERGFTELREDEHWDVRPGGKYYVTKNSSALIAFCVGGGDYSFRLAESHTDSPSLRVKGNTLVESPEGKRLNVEEYGGMLRYSFLDIPLRIAGRLVCRDADGNLYAEITASDFNVNIPSLAIHHNRDANQNLALNVQTDMLPLVGNGNDVYGLLAPETDVLDADLYVVPDVKPYRTGKDGALLASPRIDNLTSVYASVKAISECTPDGVAVICLFDNEEVGSHTKQGACSRFLSSVLTRISNSLGKTQEEHEIAIAKSFALSIDNGHAVHPAHPEKSDITEKVYLNGGIVVKHHVNYATDGFSSATFKNILRNANIKYQDYYNRSDLRCGSTLGLITSADLGIPVCDIGLAQLAMHSAVETVGYNDIALMESGVRAFLDA